MAWRVWIRRPSCKLAGQAARRRTALAAVADQRSQLLGVREEKGVLDVEMSVEMADSNQTS